MAITIHIFLDANTLLNSMLFPNICNLDPSREREINFFGNACESFKVIIELDGDLL
jgi:hypothetical protein